MKAIIFDFDNTLEAWDPLQIAGEVAVASTVAARHGITPRQFLSVYNDSKTAWKDTGTPEDFSRRRTVADALARLGLKDDAGALERVYWDAVLKEATLFPHAKDVLQQLARSCTLALLSDSDGKREFKEERITKLGIDHFFKVIVTSDDTGKNKPDPAGFQLILQRLKVDAADIVAVGNQPPKDLFPAKRLGMKTVWTQESLRSDVHFSYVDAIIYSLPELPVLLKKWNKYNREQK